MDLTTEELGEFTNVETDDLVRILDEDAFGGFVILSRAEEEFLQAGNNWSPDDECATFLERYDSDPWVLEYREPSGKQYQTCRNVTLAEVKEAFLSYLRGGTEWRDRFEWSEIEA